MKPVKKKKSAPALGYANGYSVEGLSPVQMQILDEKLSTVDPVLKPKNFRRSAKSPLWVPRHYVPRVIRSTLPIPDLPPRVTAFRMGPWAACTRCGGNTRAWLAGRALHMVCAPTYISLFEYLEMTEHAVSTLTNKENT